LDFLFEKTCIAQTEHICLADTTNASFKSNYQSWQGYFHQLPSTLASIKPTGTYRLLNIMVNIIYDQTDTLDPKYNITCNLWPAASEQGINNQSIPTYLITDFIDVLDNGQVHGVMTRLFYESSFGNLLLLGDFIVVNIKQSYITPNNPGANFSLDILISKVFSLINLNGGLSTINGYNALSDYDSDGDGNIDMVQILLRNTLNKNNYNFGGVNSGSGRIFSKYSFNLIINGQLKNNLSVLSYQGIGCGGHALNPTGIAIHEFSHALFGGNSFHTSGGNHYLLGGINTWFGVEGGYGLMGAYNSGLVSCNGYERWRMHWTSPVYNPNNYLIQANGVPSNISREDGPKTFILRDFVTTGDAVRIKLPYIDEGASNQYIWLENHQIGSNNKLDYLQYSRNPDFSVWASCRPTGSEGIYSYIQVGKDILEGTSSEVYPTNETDNLRIISAEGNWDYVKLDDENPNCVNHSHSRAEKRLIPNPLSGYQDQTYHFFSDSLFLHGHDGKLLYSKYDNNNQLISSGLPGLGDNFDAFSGRSHMDIGSNPSPVNMATFYTWQEGGGFIATDASRNNRSIYLSGLKITMDDNPDGTYLIGISWDNYEVINDVRWTGNIVLKEKVILAENKTIELDQNFTPNQIKRDPISGYFSKPTYFSCEDESEFVLEKNASLIVNNKSTLHLKAGSTFIIKDNAELVIESDTLKIDPCAKIIIEGNGKLVAKPNSVICISEGAIIATDLGISNIDWQTNNIPQGYIHPHLIVPTNNIILTNTTWQDKSYFANTIIIEPGATLNILDSDLFFPAKNSKMIIKPGGKLYVNNSNISSSCGGIWRGIYVVGDRTKPQTFENQGAVIMENGAVIENSEYGVRLRGFGEAWHTNGGIIQATNSTFRNNWRNVEFMNYKNTNGQGQEIPTISYFTNCNFITDEQTLHNVHWGNVTIWDVNGVNFTGCEFIDERQNLDFQAYRQARDGIYTISAGFSVNNSNFEGLKYGIHSTTEVPNRTFSVNNSTFSTYRGIYFNAIDNAFIVGNTFSVAPGYTYAGQPCADTYGIYIDNSSMFTVEDNVLSSSSNGSTTCGSLGLIARNTGIFQNEIYRNTFSNFTIGIEAIGKNKGLNLQEGLQIKCNIFNDNAYDIYVAPGKNYSKPEGIRQLQGYAGSPSTSTLAGNLFGNNSPILISNFVNQCDNISYFHHNVQSEPRVKPANYSSKIFFYESPNLIFNYDASCPVNTHSKSYPELLAEKQNAHSLFETTSQQLQDMVDQGNTEMTTQQVEMANTGNAWYTYQSLMQTSPYLSDQVLTALGAKEEGFNKAMIRDVMLINPQAAKSEAVQEALDARADQLPAYMRWQIDNGLFHFGQKEIAEQFMAYQKTRHDQALNQIIQGIVHERDGFGNAPAVEALLAQTNDIRYQYLLAELQFSKSDFTTGNQFLSQVEQSFDITHEEAWQAHQDYLDFYALLAQWHHADYPGYSGLPEEALQQLEGFLEATPRVAGKALSLLMLNHAIEYEEPILYPSEEVAAMSAPILPPAPFLAPGESESELKSALFPSPAKEYITLSWCLETDREIKGNIEFRDARGLLVFTMPVHQACDQQNLPLSGWKSGAYTATISLGAGFRKSISFVVSR
jgi:hypothetical protein